MSSPRLIATLDDALSRLPQEVVNNNDANASVMVQFAADDWRKIKADLAEAKTEAGDDATLAADLDAATKQRDDARAQVSDLTMKMAEEQAKLTIAEARITQLEPNMKYGKRKSRRSRR